MSEEVEQQAHEHVISGDAAAHALVTALAQDAAEEAEQAEQAEPVTPNVIVFYPGRGTDDLTEEELAEIAANPRYPGAKPLPATPIGGGAPGPAEEKSSPKLSNT